MSIIKDKTFWLKVIKFIIELILEGKSKDKAFAEASRKFAVSIDEIKKHYKN
ncbi:hypothetical protein ABEV15_10600 [Bhargavaea massiliensis]